jgi:hypothetical protein
MTDAGAPKRARDEIEVPALLEYFDHVSTPATARVVSYSDARRVYRAVTAGFTCWGLAALTILVPVAHFFLVPFFFFAGPVMVFMRLGEGVSLRGAHGKCPACGREQDFTESGRLRERHPVRCEECGRQLELVATVPRPE